MLDISIFLGIIEDIYYKAFSQDIYIKVNNLAVNSNNSIENNQEFVNYIRFLQQVKTYYTLKYTIKFRDISLIYQVILLYYIYFHRTKQYKYTLKILTLQQLLIIDITTSKLKTAILSSMLINLRGRGDLQLLANLINKHLNLELKIELYIKSNSIFNINYLFKTTILTSRYTLMLKQVIE